MCRTLSKKIVFRSLVAFGLAVLAPSPWAQQSKGGSESPQAAWSTIRKRLSTAPLDGWAFLTEPSDRDSSPEAPRKDRLTAHVSISFPSVRRLSFLVNCVDGKMPTLQ